MVCRFRGSFGPEMLGGKCGDIHLDRFESTNQRSRDVIDKPLLRFNDVGIVQHVSEELRLVECLEPCRNRFSQSY